MKTLTVYGGTTFRSFKEFLSTKQTRAIVATYTKKQAMEIANVSRSTFRDYWCRTGNPTELATATEVGMWVYNDNVELVKVK